MVNKIELMRQAVESAIAKQGLFDSGDRVLIGVSGGADSVALVYILHYLRDKIGISIKLAHLHHRIRGAEADADLRSVRDLAAKLNLTLVCDYCDIPALAAARGISIEMAAREARLNFFRQQTKALEIDKLALAHNADDQAETLLLRLSRGAGRSGLSGIAAMRNLPGLTIVRPMLNVTHMQAVGFLRAHNLSWREDSSNTSMEHLRNRVRHEVLPVLAEKLNPNIRGALCRSAEILGAEDDYMDSQAKAALTEVLEPDSDVIDIRKLWQIPLALRRRILHSWLYGGGVPEHLASFDKVDAIDALARNAFGTQRICIGSGYLAVCSYGRLRIVKESSPATGKEFAVEVPGTTWIDKLGIEITTEWSRGIVRERDRRPGDLPAVATIAAEKVEGFELQVRTWRAGDRMTPYGLAGTKKLQDIFTDQKVPDYRRDRIPVFECRGEIVWIPGYRIAADWIVGSDQDRCLRVQCSACHDVMSRRREA